MRTQRLSIFAVFFMLAGLIPFGAGVALAATTVVIDAGNMGGWAFQASLTSTAKFAVGPATPPLGQGSARLSVGPDGNGAAQIRNAGYGGTLLSDISALSYSTYVSQTGSGGQAPYVILNVDLDGNGSTDDQLFFEPVYQTGAYGGDPVPNQGTVALNTWQTWDAYVGGWWSLDAATFGPPLTTLANYIASHPGAQIASIGSGAVRLVAGFGAGAWDNFDGNVDNVTIGVNTNDTTYDFEPTFTWMGQTWDVSGNASATVDGNGHAILTRTSGVADATLHLNRIAPISGGDSWINQFGTPWVQLTYEDNGMHRGVDLFIDDETLPMNPRLQAGSLFSCNGLGYARYSNPSTVETIAFADGCTGSGVGTRMNGDVHTVYAGQRADGTIDYNFDGDWYTTTYLKDNVGPFDFNDIYLRLRGDNGATATFIDFQYGDDHQEPYGPIASDVVAAPAPAAVNASVTLTATLDDATTGSSNIASADYSLDNGATWSPMAATDGSFDEVAENVTATFNAPATAGIYDACVRGTDAAGNTGVSECIMFVVYDPSGGFVTGGGWFESPTSAYPAGLVWSQGFETDTAGWLDIDDAWAGTITRVPSGTNGVASASGTSHAIMTGQPGDSGPFTRFDDYRSAWPGAWVASIDVYLDTAWASGEGFDYSVAANGVDGNHQRDFIFHVAKDTSTGMLIVAGSNNTNFATREDLDTLANHLVVNQSGWYTFQHVFRDDGGVLAVDLNVLDSDGTLLFTETRTTPADTIPAEVGGNRYGWFTFIDVASGIAVDNHSLDLLEDGIAGRAHFGFVSKYKKGANVPDGKTDFRFKAGNLNFASTSYDWLVVAGNIAKFKGSGTINGQLSPNGEYRFMIWAEDGELKNPIGPDTFRIKIWWEDGDGEHVVYDNGSNQAIGGGSIVIHK